MYTCIHVYMYTGILIYSIYNTSTVNETKTGTCVYLYRMLDYITMDTTNIRVYEYTVTVCPPRLV